MSKSSWVIRNVEEIIGCTLVAIMVLTVTIGVVSRTLDFSVTWTDELSRYTFIWTIYLGSVVAVKRKGHIAIDTLLTVLPQRLKTGLYLLIQLILLAVFAIMLEYGYSLAVQTWDVPTTSLQIPTGLVYASVPISAILMMAYTCKDMWQTLRKT